jgi:hypothetical protein
MDATHMQDMPEHFHHSVILYWQMLLRNLYQEKQTCSDL